VLPKNLYHQKLGEATDYRNHHQAAEGDHPTVRRYIIELFKYWCYRTRYLFFITKFIL